jgi:hypothetical protein
MGKYADAECDGKECLRLYRQLVPEDSRSLDLLTGEDFDKLIVFWSR